MLGVIDILIYGLALHAELFRNLGVADAFSMQFQNLYGLIGGKLRLATRIARIWIIDFQHDISYSTLLPGYKGEPPARLLETAPTSCTTLLAVPPTP